MNLIEQLGGYEAAKEYLANLEKIPMHEQTEDTLAWLPDILLQYRRENNIFDMGDYIVHEGELKVFAMWSTAIDGCAYIGYAYAEDGEMAHKDEFRHATPEEIEAWERPN